MNQSSLKNILSAKFDFNVWKELLVKFFPKVDFFTSIATITDSLVTKQEMSPNERQTALTDMITLALETAIKI